MSNTTPPSIEEFYKTHTLKDDFDEVAYQKQYPDTIDFYQPYCRENFITEKQRLFFHYSQYGQYKIVRNNTYYPTETLIPIKKGCHVFSYEACEKDSDVYFRQNRAITSYADHKHENIKIYNLADQPSSFTNIIYSKIDNIQKIIDSNRDYYFLNGLIDFAADRLDDDDYIIFTNSDCYIEKYFYEFILTSPYEYIEFFRSDIQGEWIIRENKDGIDGFAIQKKTYTELKKSNLVPNHLIIGAPFWDAIWSSIARKYIKNKYQDSKRLKHLYHAPRWSFDSLDIAGKNNLAILDQLYIDEIINCRKAEIVSDNLIIKIFDDSTDYSKVKPIILDERFGFRKNIDFDYNYLFIEQYIDKPKLSDDAIGTSAGTRVHLLQDSDVSQNIEQIISTYRKQYKKIAIVNQYHSINSNIVFEPSINITQLGIVLCFFGSDQIRVYAVKKAIQELSKQTLWNKSSIVFIELLSPDQTSNFNFDEYSNINHIKMIQSDKNNNLFQKECLWNIGAKILNNSVDNYVFIDADTYPQNIHTFAKANKLLEHNPNIVYQLGNYVITQKDSTITRIQMLWKYFSTLKSSAPYCFNPCGGFAISKSVFEQINGFNPYGFLYGGDILFLYEIDNMSRHVYDKFIHEMNIFCNAIRKDIKNENIVIKYEDAPMIHVWHGDHSERPYHAWGQKFKLLDFDLHRDIKLGENGLLEWQQGEMPNQLIDFFNNRNQP